jgi:hypothetical protein
MRLTLASLREEPGQRSCLSSLAQFRGELGTEGDGPPSIAKTRKSGSTASKFFDDNPAEREHIRQALPDVAVVEVPDDPAEPGMGARCVAVVQRSR